MGPSGVKEAILGLGEVWMILDVKVRLLRLVLYCFDLNTYVSFLFKLLSSWFVLSQLNRHLALIMMHLLAWLWIVSTKAPSISAAIHVGSSSAYSLCRYFSSHSHAWIVDTAPYIYLYDLTIIFFVSFFSCQYFKPQAAALKANQSVL